jgi:hypothetical protein
MRLNCEYCKESFERHTPKQRFCSNSCRVMNSNRNLTTNRNLRLAELTQQNEDLQAQLKDLSCLKQENERLKCVVRQKNTELAQLSDINEQQNLELENNRQPTSLPLEVTLIKHSAPTANQARHFAGIGKRIAMKEVEERFKNMTDDEIDYLFDTLRHKIEQRSKRLNDPQTIDHDD